MAQGTAAGLLEQQRSQSVFKHKILAYYLLPFATMTASKTEGRRVVVVDGYAGRGRYPNGEPASAELILRSAMKAPGARVETILVEKKRSDFTNLNLVVSEYVGKGARAKARHGTFDMFLPEVIQAAAKALLFMFLDPCGAGLPFSTLSDVLTGPRKASWPRTEVLLNFSADLTRRAAGALNAGYLEHDSLPVMDRTCGGDWWRDVAMAARAAAGSTSFEEAAEAVVTEYAFRLGTAAGMNSVAIPVRRKINNQPIYHLVFLSKSAHGLWLFADAIARARVDWLHALGPVENDDANALFSFGQTVDQMLVAEEVQAINTVADNLRRALGSRPQLKLVDEPGLVFGEMYGIANETVVGKALRQLVGAGEAEVIATAKKTRDRVVKGTSALRPPR